jgi:hypothetical protein
VNNDLNNASQQKRRWYEPKLQILRPPSGTSTLVMGEMGKEMNNGENGGNPDMGLNTVGPS